jgi:transposase
MTEGFNNQIKLIQRRAFGLRHEPTGKNGRDVCRRTG